MVETDLATQRWSSKSEGYAKYSQHVQHAIAREVAGMPLRELFKNTHPEIESEGIFKNI